MYDTRSIKALRRVSLTINLWRIAWLKASKKAIESPKSRRKKRSKQSLQRRAKRGLRRVGSRPLDQARRNRSESLPQCDGKPTAPASPWQNGFAERLIGSIRRECVDHIIVLSETHLRRILRSYACYYNDIRTHRSLDKDAPVSHPVRRDIRKPRS